MTSKQSFDIFISQHLDHTYKLAGIYIKNPQDVEDVVQESIEKALRNIHSLKDPDSVKAWFYKIVIHTALNHIKKHSPIVPMGTTPPIRYIDDFSQLAFRELLETLPSIDKQIVSLRFCENCKLKEIAETLHMKESSVKTRLYRALYKLKLEITADGDRIAVKEPPRKKIANRVTLWVIALLLASTCVFNLSPTLSAAAYEIPILGDIVKIITLKRFSYEDKGYKAHMNVPQIKGLLDQALQDRLNTEFREFADELIRSFEAALTGISDEPQYREPAHMSIKADYIVCADTERVLSINTYLFSDTNNFTVHKFCTIDKQSGTLITLDALFKPGTDYITPLSRYILTEMERRNTEEDATFTTDNNMFEAFTKIHSDQNFYVNENNSLVICFDKYEVATGVEGSPEFIIPYDIIMDLLATDLVQP